MLLMGSGLGRLRGEIQMLLDSSRDAYRTRQALLLSGALLFLIGFCPACSCRKCTTRAWPVGAPGRGAERPCVTGLCCRVGACGTDAAFSATALRVEHRRHVWILGRAAIGGAMGYKSGHANCRGRLRGDLLTGAVCLSPAQGLVRRVHIRGPLVACGLPARLEVAVALRADHQAAEPDTNMCASVWQR